MYSPYGILPAMVTPMAKNGMVDEKALRRLINFLIEGGVHGIYAVGTTGEFYAISDDEYREILQITKDEVKGRVPVCAGANHITTRGSIRLAQIAEEAGVDAVSVLTPYFISPSQEELVKHFTAIAESTSLPVIMYNNLPKTHVDIKPKTVERLAKVSNIVAIKDSSGDLTQTGEYIRLTKGEDFSVMMGRDTMIYAALSYGASGAVASCANVAPRLVVDIYDNFKKGNSAAALEAQYKLAPLRIAFSLGTFPAVIKEALNLMGLDVGACFAPADPLSAEEREQLKKILIQMEVLR